MGIRAHLDERSIRYGFFEHRDTFRARDTAQALRENLDAFAKTVLLRTMRGFVVAIVPASCQVDLRKAAQALNVEKVCLATERELKDVFYDCEVGVVPAFGSLYGLKTLVDPFLAAMPAMILEGDSHHEALSIRWADFRRLEHPMVARIAYPYEPSPRTTIASEDWH